MVPVSSWECAGDQFALDDAEVAGGVGDGLLEEREVAARVWVEEPQAEVGRILAEFAAAEEVLERRVIAQSEMAESLSAPGDADASSM